MPGSPETAAPAETVLNEAVLLPSEAFFVRRVTLDTAADAASQVELALETSAPFAVAQLFHGFVRSADGPHALVFATHRRIFAAAGWDGALTVLPSFAALLGEPPTAPKLRGWNDGATLTIAGWDGTGSLPVLVLARRLDAGTEAETRAELLAEAQRRLGGELPLEEFSGPAEVATLKSGGIKLTLAHGGGGRQLVTRWEPVELETMDVRDKAVLAGRKQALRRDLLLWRVLLGGLAALLVAGLLELAMLGGGVLLRRLRADVAAIAPEVEKIQTAQALGARIEEMSQRRLRPFEMLAVLNQVRPNGVVFTRSVTSGQGSIEIEAQTANADAVGVFESALRALPGIESVDVRDLRLRDGLTTFLLTAGFREGSLAGVGGTEGAK